MYKEHSVFEAPDKEQKIWRYMDFTRLISILEKQALHFSRIDKLNDPFEGKYSKANIKNIDKICEAANVEKKHLKTIMGLDGNQFVKKLREWTVVNCWHINNKESAAMWKLYLKSEEGVAIQTTFEKLCNSFKDCDENIHIGKVKYLDYDKDFMPIGNMFNPFIYKRKCFEHEKELRALYQKLPLDDEKINFDKNLFKNGKYISVDPNILIHKIYISPTAKNWFKELVEALVKKYNLNKEIIHSDLYEY